MVPEHDLLVGDSASGLKGSIRFWSLDEDKFKHIIEPGEGVWIKSSAVRMLTLDSKSFLNTAPSDHDIIVRSSTSI